MDRLYLDACVIFSAAYNPDSPLGILWKLDDVELLASRLVLEEARRNLAVLRSARLGRLERLCAGMQVVDAILPEAPTDVRGLPDKDLPILLAAVACRATHFLTVDKKHSGSLFGKTIAHVLILPPWDYLKRREGMGSR